VEAALASRHDVDASGEVIELSTGGCPWKEHLYQLEREQSIQPPVKYVIYQVLSVYAGCFDTGSAWTRTTAVVAGSTV